MLNGKKIVVVMPAYNAARTLRQTWAEIPRDVVDDVLLVDDASRDETVEIAAELGIRYFVHPANLGYGGNQKTCYRKALALGADVVVMLHPDYQYTPRLITAMAAMVASGVYDVALGSRVLGRGALAGGMPIYKFVANRTLTFVQNLCLGQRLTEYHTGYRAFSRDVLLRLPLEELANDFVFDNELLAQLVYFGYEISEITCPAKYFDEASSITLWRSLRYGLGVLGTTLRCMLARAGVRSYPMYDPDGRKLMVDEARDPSQAADPVRAPAADHGSMFPYERWTRALPSLTREYSQRSPFPHVHLDQFLDDEPAGALAQEFDAATAGHWIQYKHYNENKQGLNVRTALPPTIGEVVDELNSDRFVAWLSALTGIPGLIADPSLEGGGMHQSGRSGFLNVHADFTKHHHQRNWRRRVNVILYLNPGWQEEWGGAIELWDKAMTRCEVRVPPLFNRALIFNTDDDSYHGFPDPITCPQKVTRKSLALYYYTVEDPGAETLPRSTWYRARPDDGSRTRALIWADRQLVHLYSSAKTALGLSDDFASRVLGAFSRGRDGRPSTATGIRLLEFAYWAIGIGFGALQAWVWRFRPSSIDGVSYLDVGDAWVHGRWREAINGYWNPLYSWILGIVMAVVQPSARLEYPTERAVDLAVFVLCLFSFAWFLRRLIADYRRETGAPGQAVTIPDWAWIVVGYTVFLWTSVRWITIAASTPDMCAAALAYWAWGLSLGPRDQQRASRHALLGLVLALGFFSRTPMFIVGLALVAALALSRARIDRRGALVTLAVFFLLTGPYVAAISVARGHVTIGDNGKLNHIWLTNPGSYIVPNHHWQGGPDGNGLPVHPSRLLWDSPATFEFGSPIGGTYPPWTDPSYWYEGLRYRFRAAPEWLSIQHNSVVYAWLFGIPLLAMLTVVLGLAGDVRATARAVVRHAGFWLPAAIGLALHFFADDLLVEVLPSQRSYRYVAVFVAIVSMSAAASMRFRSIRRPVWRALGAGLAVTSAGMLAMLVSDEVVRWRSPAPTPPWLIARDLEQAGVVRGTPVATIGSPAYHAFWARLDGARIIAEVPNEASFWSKPLATRRLALRALARTGALAAVAPWVPDSALGDGWTRTADGYGIHFLEEDGRDPEGLQP